MPGRWILHADMDAFFASVEQRDDPSLRGRPVIVGATSARGVVAAASYEARRFGVRSAMPGFQARQLCPQGVFLPCDMGRYVAVSAQVREVFERFTPEVEPLALDEAFLDITASVNLFGGVLPLARALKQGVREATALAVSVGVAPSKLVAKIACTLGKPDGLRLVEPDQVQALLRPLPVRRLWGVGPKTAERLERVGLKTCAELADAPLGRLERIVGQEAVILQQLARGVDGRPVQANSDPHSYGEVNTFEVDLDETTQITDVLRAHSDAVTRRLRRDGWRARTVTLRVKPAAKVRGAGGNPYRLLAKSRTLTESVDDGFAVGKLAVELWAELGLREPVRLLGVACSNLEPASQLSLLPSTRPATERVGPVLDAIEARFGRGSIRRGPDAPGKLTPSIQRKRGE